MRRRNARNHARRRASGDIQPLLSIRLDAPGFFDNEARYAEVAREMLLSGDWISPHLDFTLFLNKPPLTFWLTALVFEVAGPGQWGRLVPVAAAAVTVLATARLGALLYGQAAGLFGTVALATSVGFVDVGRGSEGTAIFTGVDYPF